MSTIEIEWLYDSHDCETCGGSYAEGASVRIDSVEAISLKPVAHCFDGDHHNESDVYKAILKHLGHTVLD